MVSPAPPEFATIGLVKIDDSVLTPIIYDPSISDNTEELDEIPVEIVVTPEIIARSLFCQLCSGKTEIFKVSLLTQLITALSNTDEATLTLVTVFPSIDDTDADKPSPPVPSFSKFNISFIL